MAYTFSELLRDVYDALGRQVAQGLVATGGSTTTIVDTTLKDDYQDDHFKNYYAFVVRDAGGAGAAPQNEFQLVSAYNATTKTLTTGTFTAAIAASDEIMLTKPNPFPLADVKRLCNSALWELGEIPNKDTSITFDESTYSYTLPSTIRKRPEEIWYLPTDADQYEKLADWDVIPNTAGSNWTLYVDSPPDGTALILYNGLHPRLSAYNDSVSEAIPPPLAKAVCAWYIARWHSNSDETWLDETARLQQLYQETLMRNPIVSKHKPRNKGMPQW